MVMAMATNHDELYLWLLDVMSKHQITISIHQQWLNDAERTLDRMEREGLVSEAVRRLRDAEPGD
jgi:hypothetical protein